MELGVRNYLKKHGPHGDPEWRNVTLAQDSEKSRAVTNTLFQTLERHLNGENKKAYHSENSLLTLCLTFLLTFWLTFFLASLPTNSPALSVAFSLTFFLTCLLAFFVAILLTIFLASLVTFFLAISPRISSGISSDIQTYLLTFCLAIFLPSLLTFFRVKATHGKISGFFERFCFSFALLVQTRCSTVTSSGCGKQNPEKRPGHAKQRDATEGSVTTRKRKNRAK